MHMPPDVEKKKYGGNRGGWGTTNEKDDDIYYDHQSADSAIEFLQNRAPGGPFYREVGFYSPHGPHYTPARFKEMYNQKAFRMPEEWAGGFDTNAYADEIFLQNIDPAKKQWWQQSVRNYYSALSHGDYHLGRVWDALKASPHAENTIFIIVADHGFHLGNLNRYKKTTLWEQVAGVPLIVHDPSHPEARVVQDRLPCWISVRRCRIIATSPRRRARWVNRCDRSSKAAAIPTGPLRPSISTMSPSGRAISG